MINSDESVMVTWADNGMVDGSFALSLVNTIVHIKDKFNLQFFSRSKGNQIARQRSELFEHWEEQGTDWLLWIDSDVVFTRESLDVLMHHAHKDLIKVISGVYFTINPRIDTPLPVPYPAIFKEDEKGFPKTIHPLPKNQLIEIDHAGFGFLLMHKSIIEKIKEVANDNSVFAETLKKNMPFIGEDIAFFMNLKKAGIQAYAHTGALAEHMKTFPLDENYYKAYWGEVLQDNG